MATSRVVIAGLPGAGKSTLLAGIYQVVHELQNGKAAPFAAPVGQEIELGASGHRAELFSSPPLSLSTKYYDADLEVLLLPSELLLLLLPPPPPTTTAAAGADEDGNGDGKDAAPVRAAGTSSAVAALVAALKGAEALIFVADASRRAESLSSAAIWPAFFEQHEEGLGGAAPPCLLCVVNKCDVAGGGVVPGTAPEDGGDELEQEQEREVGGGGVGVAGGNGRGYGSITPVAEGADAARRAAQEARGIAAASVPREHRDFLARMQEWCLDAGFESVECAATHPSASIRAREKVGVPRVVEALQSNMWGSMRRKTGGGGGLMMGLAGAAASSSGLGSKSDGAEGGGGGGGSGGGADDADGDDGEEENGDDGDVGETVEVQSLRAEIEAMRLKAAVARGDEFVEGTDSAGAGDGGAGAGADAGSGAGAVPAASTASAVPARSAPGALPPGDAAGLAELEAAIAEGDPDRNGAGGGGGGGGGDGDGEDEVGKLMGQMKAVREAATRGGMADDDRREAAARMALRLLAMMGEDGDPSELLMGGLMMGGAGGGVKKGKGGSAAKKK